jgi:hypothetical protein
MSRSWRFFLTWSFIYTGVGLATVPVIVHAYGPMHGLKAFEVVLGMCIVTGVIAERMTR